jgi:hypothetical protein
MKPTRLIALVLCVAFLVGATLVLHSAAPVAPAKTISGEAKCAKVDLKSGDSCQTVIQAKEGEKVVNYLVVENEATKGFHAKVCGKPQKVSATGTVATVNGKLQLTPAKIELVK